MAAQSRSPRFVSLAVAALCLAQLQDSAHGGTAAPEERSMFLLPSSGRRDASDVFGLSLGYDPIPTNDAAPTQLWPLDIRRADKKNVRGDIDVASLMADLWGAATLHDNLVGAFGLVLAAPLGDDLHQSLVYVQEQLRARRFNVMPLLDKLQLLRSVDSRRQLVILFTELRKIVPPYLRDDATVWMDGLASGEVDVDCLPAVDFLSGIPGEGLEELGGPVYYPREVVMKSSKEITRLMGIYFANVFAALGEGELRLTQELFAALLLHIPLDDATSAVEETRRCLSDFLRAGAVQDWTSIVLAPADLREPYDFLGAALGAIVDVADAAPRVKAAARYLLPHARARRTQQSAPALHVAALLGSITDADYPAYVVDLKRTILSAINTTQLDVATVTKELNTFQYRDSKSLLIAFLTRVLYKSPDITEELSSSVNSLRLYLTFSSLQCSSATQLPDNFIDGIALFESLTDVTLPLNVREVQTRILTLLESENLNWTTVLQGAPMERCSTPRKCVIYAMDRIMERKVIKNQEILTLFIKVKDMLSHDDASCMEEANGPVTPTRSSSTTESDEPESELGSPTGEVLTKSAEEDGEKLSPQGRTRDTDLGNSTAHSTGAPSRPHSPTTAAPDRSGPGGSDEKYPSYILIPGVQLGQDEVLWQVPINLYPEIFNISNIPAGQIPALPLPKELKPDSFPAIDKKFELEPAAPERPEKLLPPTAPGSKEDLVLKPIRAFLKHLNMSFFGPEFHPRDYPTKGDLLRAILRESLKLEKVNKNVRLFVTMIFYLNYLDDPQSPEKPYPTGTVPYPYNRTRLESPEIPFNPVDTAFGQQKADPKHPENLIPRVANGSPEHVKMKAIRLFLGQPNLYGMLGPEFDPSKYKTKLQLLLAILEAALKVPQVKGDTVLFFILSMYVRHLKSPQSVRQVSNFLTLLKALPTPMTKQERAMFVSLAEFLSLPNLFALYEDAVTLTDYHTIGASLQHLLEMSLELDEVCEDAQLLRAVRYYKDRVYLTGPGLQGIRWIVYKMEVTRINLDLQAIFESVDTDALTPQARAARNRIVAFLNEGFEPKKVFRGFRFRKYKTNGELLRAAFHFVLSHDTVPTSLKPAVTLLLPFVRLTGPGARPVSY